MGENLGGWNCKGLVETERFGVWCENGAISSEKFPVSSEKFPVSSEKFPVSSEKFPVSSERFVVASETVLMRNHKVPVCHENNSVGNGRDRGGSEKVSGFGETFLLEKYRYSLNFGVAPISDPGSLPAGTIANGAPKIPRI